MAQFSHSAGGVVIDTAGRVLLVRQRDGSWSFPKGGVREGEDPRDAAIREVAEESGLAGLVMVRLLHSYVRCGFLENGKQDFGRLKRVTMYLFRATDTAVHPMDPRVQSAQWTAAQDVSAYLLHPKDRAFFQKIQRELDTALLT